MEATMTEVSKFAALIEDLDASIAYDRKAIAEFAAALASDRPLSAVQWAGTAVNAAARVELMIGVKNWIATTEALGTPITPELVERMCDDWIERCISEAVSTGTSGPANVARLTALEQAQSKLGRRSMSSIRSQLVKAAAKSEG